MKIGVITPMRNAEGFIKRAIDSVKNQANVDAEIVHYIYDDASNDGSYRIALENMPIDGRIISGSVRCGQSEARNKLIELAKSDGCNIAAFLDADDCWDSSHLCRALFFLGANADISYGTVECVNDSGEVMIPEGIPVPHIFIGKHLEYKNFIWISSVVAGIHCFDCNKFDSELDGIEDWDMWYRLFKAGFRFGNDKTPTTIYRVNPDGEGAKSSYKIDKLRSKHGFNMPELKLHLACGEDYQPGYINVDLYPLPTAKIDAQFDIQKLPYDDESVDCIRALHVIEHFTFKECKAVFDEWYRVLKPGGLLILETPDFLSTCQEFVKADEQGRVNLYGHFFAFPDLPGQIHKFLFTETQLRCQLGWANFHNVVRIKPMSNYVTPGREHLFLAMGAYK